MPGLSQLKNFSSDLLSLGDELTVRASRGEKPVKVEIPKTIEDVNDSDDFVLGMPLKEAEIQSEAIDDDLSDLSSLINPTANTNEQSAENNEENAFAAPDLSALLNPIATEENTQGEMPDLSMFVDEPIEEEAPVEEEPEEVSIADMGLDALLAGAGFGEDESETINNNSTFDLDNSLEEEDDLANYGTFNKPDDDFETSSLDGQYIQEEDLQEGEPSLDDLLGNLKSTEDFTPSEDMPSMDDSFETPTDMPSMDEFAVSDEMPPLEENFDTSVEMPPLDENFDTATEMPSLDDSFETSTDMPPLDEDFSSSGEMPPLDDNFTTPTDMPSMDEFAVSDEMPPLEENFDTSVEMPPLDENFDSATEMPSLDENFDTATEKPSLDENFAPTTDLPPLDENFDTATEMPSLDENFDASAEMTSLDDDFTSPTETPSFDDDFAPTTEAPDFSATDIVPDYDDAESLDSVENLDEIQEEVSPEIFDTSAMEGLDFGIPDTDSQLDGGADSFELGEDDEFAMEGEFEIPGFSDVSTAHEEEPEKLNLATKNKGKKSKKVAEKLPEPDFSDAEESEDLPPNTLSESQYKRFLKNFSEYPLNVRLAFEDLIVQDEFTDDAEFEIIEKILNKAPARQVASSLEKMLDISLPVPRDFEHRSADEYEAYKKSLSYQLRNRIIPGILVGIVMIFVLFGVFQFSKNCIYKPLKASSLYKQGYALLQADEYPQSQMKFDQAVKYRINKNWFFKYARGYREHKQYQRAEKMYENILYCFKHDKAAGLEYADMELDDLANYEKAEKIVRREVLDYHINDKDGILKLGDIFLEWGTEKDPEKLEMAREQYATLIQLYKPNDLYLSRMMRYFIRTDNLRQVIQSQKSFENKKEKALASEDWAELSGYLLDKYYGPLAPSDEYLRYEIEGIRKLLLTAVKTDPNNPIALYNLSKYFIKTGETNVIENTLRNAIEKFNAVPSMKTRDIYKYIDSYRLLGEYYITTTDYLQAQEQFAEGISLFTIERDNAGFVGTPEIGKLYEDMGDIKYSISGDYDDALQNYSYSVELENDNPSLRYRIGYIQYNKNNYAEALGSFMKAGDGNIKERNLLLAMANTLCLRGDDYAAQGYYDQLLDTLDSQIVEQGRVFPQVNVKDYDVVNTYLYAANNYGVTLYKLAKRTGNSALNAQAIVQFSQSIRAWDALTRNQETLVRLSGSNLAEMNIQYITHPIPDFEPSIYSDISKTLYDNEHL